MTAVLLSCTDVKVGIHPQQQGSGSGSAAPGTLNSQLNRKHRILGLRFWVIGFRV